MSPLPAVHAWFRLARGGAVAGVLALVWNVSLAAASTRLTVVHTNDLHDHLRSGPDGRGGVAYVASYIHAVRTEDPEALVLDAGDVTEKGDLVAFKTHGRLTYEILRRIGYDAVTIGNHDADAGIDWLRRYEETLGQRLLCFNVLDANGEAAFERSRIVTRHGLKIGLIGALIPQDAGTLDLEATGRQLAVEARRLDPQTSLVIAVCHAGPDVCAKWSKMAPAIDVFISGHTHEQLATLRIVPETGARIVQAGSNARHVGRLDLEFDVTGERLVGARSEVVPMDHQKFRPDIAITELVASQENALCPNAGKTIATASALIGPEIAWLAADAMRIAGGVDVAFCNPGHVIRDFLPPGQVTVNSLFLTGGQRGHAVVETTLTGAEITAYLNALEASPSDQTAWAGLSATVERNRDGRKMLVTDLLPARRYRALLPAIEWDKRFLRAASRAEKSDPSGPLAARSFEAKPSSVTFIDALVALLEHLPEDQRNLAALIAGARTRAQPAKLERAKSD